MGCGIGGKRRAGTGFHALRKTPSHRLSYFHPAVAHAITGPMAAPVQCQAAPTHRATEGTAASAYCTASAVRSLSPGLALQPDQLAAVPLARLPSDDRLQLRSARPA